MDRQYPRHHPESAFKRDGDEWIISHPYGGQYRIQATLATDLERANQDLGKLITVLALWVRSHEAAEVELLDARSRIRAGLIALMNQYAEEDPGDPDAEPLDDLEAMETVEPDELW